MRIIIFRKKREKHFLCLELLQSLSAKCYASVFESELSRQDHTSYHITGVITNIKKKKQRFAKKTSLFSVNRSLDFVEPATARQ